ncbi:MAG: ATP-dependent DNA helicase RecG [Microgenomates group bacterium GW2011_GWA2_46_16]|nr:MAG: ATP-dependent DNA helicase RecG [Microgenomates group bacterium GW2011_GWA2_46_16]
MELLDIPGIGEKTVGTLVRHGITTPHELLTHYPRTYRAYLPRTTRSARVGEWVSLVGTLTLPVSHHGPHVTTQLSTFRDSSGTLTLRWFNSPFITRSVSPGSTYLVRGQFTIFGPTLQIVNPGLTKVEPYYQAQEELLPIYTPIGSLKSGHLRAHVRATLKVYKPLDHLSLEIQNKYNLLDLPTTLRHIHFPPSRTVLEGAIRRLAFDELYHLQLESLEKSEHNQIKTEALHWNTGKLTSWLTSLPYIPTGAQTRVLNEILSDLIKPIAMHRLLAGEVGSGKTLVAAAAALASHLSLHQTLVMAPTQILAEQLFTSFHDLLGSSLKVSLITANTQGDPSADLVVGTQALLSPKHHFGKVGLVIVDEQHKFGVKQREYLSSLAPAPHVLMMTATPIPRTLAMTIFSSMAISRLDELPKNRLPIKTYLVEEEKRERAYTWIKNEAVSNHNQAFVVVPLIEEAEDDEGNSQKSLKLLESDLKKRLPGLTIDIMHGKMKEIEKTEHLRAFRDGITQILVATSMVEVGIDIPRANIMVIEDAERFGLAQLHQLRGRVGRGDKQGYCLLFSSSNTPRLAYFKSESNGEKLALYDLENRGPGELFGQSQHGFFSLHFASIYDSELLRQTHEAVRIH